MAKAKKEKKEKKIEPYWQDLVSIYFDFTKSKFHDVPSFDGSAPRDLKSILQALRKRAEDKSVEWTYEVATTRFRHFLEWAYMDKWLSQNWLLMNINRQKDKVFFEITRQYLSR
jgi:hypothetical protein